VSISIRGFVAAVIGVLLCSGVALAAATLTKADVAPYLQAQRLVDIGGRRLNIYYTGHGSPAVILDAGAGDTTFTWRMVQPAISRVTRVCSYDRAELGFGDGGPVPRDARAAVGDLHVLLHRAGTSVPYVLVGHSEAGFYEPLYADRYPREVAGMVLVDPSFPNDEQAYDAVSPTAARMDASVANLRRLHIC
jgi:pimeloyl-ACP methyl ester carboxylesterase